MVELASRVVLFRALCCVCLVVIVASPSFVHSAESADLVVVDKTAKTLSLHRAGQAIATFNVAFGGNPTGHKQQEGDQKAPEGNYVLDYKKADSAFYKAIHISYPNEQDKARAAALGVSPGGQIMIHGQRNGLGWLGFITQWFDWTDGCIAVTNKEMEIIWSLVEAGTLITIKP